MVIASSPFPCTVSRVCICLGGVQNHPGNPTPWVIAVLGESPLWALHHSQGISSRCVIVSNLINLCETRNSYERQFG